MTPTPTKPSAAERARTLHRVITDDAAEMENNAGTLIAELTALIEKADACDAWRAEALAASEAVNGGSRFDHLEATRARLAKGLT